jgi:hypothetical protein
MTGSPMNLQGSINAKEDLAKEQRINGMQTFVH